MSADSSRRASGLAVWNEFISDPRFPQILSTLILTVALSTHAIRALIGWPGLLAILVVLLTFAGASLFVQRDRIEWRGVLPISLLVLVGWLGLSATWSAYSWVAGWSALYALVFVLLGFYLALGRDLIQIIRAAGDALRVILGASLVIELFSGLLIDAPIRFLGVTGALAQGGPIQGIAGTRNYLGFLAGLALITFATEWRTRSVTRGVGIASITGALLVLLLARSPVTFVATAGVLAAGAALLLLRRVRKSAQPAVQLSLIGLTAVLGVSAILLRTPLVRLLNANSEIESRADLWRTLQSLIALRPLEGWGWVGIWERDVFPYSSIFGPGGRAYGSALNAGVDALLQIGAVGAVILLGALGLAFVRSWMVASENPIVAYVWPALVLVLIGVTSLAESYILFEGGLMLFVACATAAARKRSWRIGFVRPDPR